MARTQKQPDTQHPNAPDFLAWHVAQSKPKVCLPLLQKNSNTPSDCFDKGEKSYWHKVGAAWRHKEIEATPSSLKRCRSMAVSSCASPSKGRKARTTTKKGAHERAPLLTNNLQGKEKTMPRYIISRGKYVVQNIIIGMSRLMLKL